MQCFVKFDAISHWLQHDTDTLVIITFVQTLATNDSPTARWQCSLFIKFWPLLDSVRMWRFVHLNIGQWLLLVCDWSEFKRYPSSCCGVLLCSIFYQTHTTVPRGEMQVNQTCCSELELYGLSPSAPSPISSACRPPFCAFPHPSCTVVMAITAV